MTENTPCANVDKETAQKEAIRLIHVLGDTSEVFDMNQVSNDLHHRYAQNARKKILEAMRQHLKTSKGFTAHSRLHVFLGRELLDVRGKDLPDLTPILMNVALAAGETTPCAMLFQFLTMTDPKKPQEYFLSDRRL